MRIVFAGMVSLVLSACAATGPERAAPEPGVEGEGGSDVLVLVEPTAAAAQPDPPQRGGLLSFLRPKPDPAPASNETRVAEALIEDGAQTVTTADGSGVVASLTDEEIAARSIRSQGQPQASTRPRLFGFLFQRVPGEATATPTPTQVMLAEQGNRPATPSLTDEEIAARSGIPNGIVPPQPEAGAAPSPIQPSFGKMVRTCDVSKREMGTEVARSPGKGTYRLYDTRPNTAAPRVQYVTGFRDGCPRQVVAAMAMFGSPVLHETKRYDPSNRRAYSAADNAYERVKARACGVARGEFCPENRIDRLGRDVALLTVYPRFGGPGQWLDVVLYRGKIEGQSIER